MAIVLDLIIVDICSINTITIIDDILRTHDLLSIDTLEREHVARLCSRRGLGARVRGCMVQIFRAFPGRFLEWVPLYPREILRAIPETLYIGA